MTSNSILTAASTEFEAARHVDVLPEGHRCRSLHGHSFAATVYARLPSRWAPYPGAEVLAVEEQLKGCVAKLNYTHLNKVLDQPTDENLARWIRRNLPLPGIERVAVRSTANQGVDLDSGGMAHVWRRYRFQAAHRLPHVPPGHKCGRMHGHGFQAIVHANQDLGSRPLSIDYDHLDELWAPLHARLNYKCLNEVPGLDNPTSEVISKWLWDRLKPELPELSWVTVYETEFCGANYDGHSYRIWKDFTMDSAVRQKRAPDTAQESAIHGHTYKLRLHVIAPLDTVMGWTIDFGDIKAVFDPVFRAIDHQPLYEIADLQDADTASIAEWIYRTTNLTLPQLVRVELYQTDGCGSIFGKHIECPILPV